MININEHSWFSDCFASLKVIAFKQNEREFTYSEIKDKIFSVSAFYISQGINANQKVPLLFTDQYKFILSVYALWNIGAVPVLMNNKLNRKEIYQQVKFVESKVIITDYVDLEIKNSNLKIILFNKETIKEEYTNLRNPFFTETALMLFTSGSSGLPKCVMLSFRNLLESVRISDNQFHYLKNSKWIASLPFYHIGGFMIFFRALLTTSSVILLNKFIELGNIIETEKPDYLSLVPTQLKNVC